jgi:hypothetical protein
MKILYLITKSNWGGAQKYVYDLATGFFCAEMMLLLRLEVRRACREAYMSLPECARFRLILWFAISYCKRTQKPRCALWHSQRRKPDVLHLNSSKAGGLGALLGRILGVPCVLFLPYTAPHFAKTDLLSIRLCHVLLTWVTCMLSHKVIAVSNRDAHDICQMLFVRRKSACHL